MRRKRKPRARWDGGEDGQGKVVVVVARMIVMVVEYAVGVVVDVDGA